MLSVSESAEVTIQSLLDQAKRLGITPVYKTGTVYANSTARGRAMVVVDGDVEPTPVFNYAGRLGTGDRVFMIVVKPAGVYVVGVTEAATRKYSLTYLDSAACSSLLALTTTTTDITGCTLTVTTTQPDAKWEVVAFFDAQMLAANTNTPRGILQVDGVDEVAMALYNANFSSNNNRATVGQVWEGTLTTPGSHTILLQGDVTGGSLQWRFNAVHTKFTLKVFE